MRAPPLGFLFLYACTCAPGQDLRITGGLVDHQVVQRGADNTAGVRLNGFTSPGWDGRALEARLLCQGVELAGFAWSPVAAVEHAAWNFVLRNVAVGGPYRLE